LALAALGPELANQVERHPEGYLRHGEEQGFIEVQFGLDDPATFTIGLEVRRDEHSFTAMKGDALTIGYSNGARQLDTLRRRIDDEFGFTVGLGA